MSLPPGKLPPNWDKPISEAHWKEALIVAVRRDISALGSARAVATLRQWRIDLGSPDPATQREAQRALTAIGMALLGPPPEERAREADPEAFTVDSYPPPVSASFAEDLEPPTAHFALPGPSAVSAASDEDGDHRRVPTPQRPRAALHHVRALYAALKPFADELVPLAFERRSRRFWARWREVAGESGVRRPFVENLLRTSTDARHMVCELIAEVQSVDPSSVDDLIEQLERTGPKSNARLAALSAVRAPSVVSSGVPRRRT